MKIKKTFLKREFYFPEDMATRNIYLVTITNNGKKCSFKFGDSIANTQAGKELDDYSILACVKSDYHITQENYPTYEDFAPEFGYDIDSRKGYKIYKACLKQAEKLNRVFTPEEIEVLPD